MPKSCTLKGANKVFRLHLDQVASCCRAQTEKLDTTKTFTDYLDHWQRQSTLLDQGIELADCESCWKDERDGRISFREQNKSLDPDNTIEIFMSNACNHMCSYCSPKFSTMWENTIKDQGMFSGISASAKKNLEVGDCSSDAKQYWLDQITEYVNTCDNDSVRITLLGGEPLMQMRTLELVQKFDLSKIKVINIITNLNPPTDKFLHWLIDNVSNDKLMFSVSLDATPEYNHVPRSGFDQTCFNKNLKAIINKDISVTFLSVLSVLSVFDLVAFTNWADDQDIAIKFSNINNPDCLDPRYIPDHFKRQLGIDKETAPEAVQNIFNTPEMVDLKLFEQYNYLLQYFSRAEIHPENIDNQLFVSYWTWLTKKFKK